MAHHILVQTALFLSTGMIERVAGTTVLSRLGGLAAASPVLAILFFIPAMNLAGVPPFSGFLGKVGLFEAGVADGRWLAIVLVAGGALTSLLTLYAMIRVWGRAFWRPVPEVAILGDAGATETESGRSPALRRRIQREAVRRAEADEAARLPGGMLGATTAVIAVGLLLTVAAGPIYAIADSAAATLLDRVDLHRRRAVHGAAAARRPRSTGGRRVRSGVRRARERAIEVRGARIPGSGGWRPYLLTVAALTLIWMALWGSAGLVVIGLGIAVAMLVLLLFPLPFLEFRFGLHPWRMLVLLLRFLGDVVVASVQVGWLALRPRPPQPEVMEVQLTTDSDLLQSLTALAVSLVPGSLIIDLDPEERTLLIHVLDAKQHPPDEFPDQVRAQERRIQLAIGDDTADLSAPPPLVGRTDRASRRRRGGGRR